MAAKPNGRFVDDDPGSTDPIVVNRIDGNGTAESPGPSGEQPDIIAGFESFDPASGSAERGSNSGSGTGKRGRPKGSRNATGAAKTQAKNNLSGLEGVLLTVHFAAAKFLEAPELQLSDGEAEAYAIAVKKVNDQYDSQFNAKTLAWIQLLTVTGGIYGTRIYAIQARRREEAKLARGGEARRPAPVVPIAGAAVKGKVVPEAGAATVEARTPADLFGLLNYSAAIPDADAT